RISRWIGDCDHVLGTKGVGGNRGDEAGVDAAGYADDHGLESVLVDVIAGAGHETLVGFCQLVEKGSRRARVWAFRLAWNGAHEDAFDGGGRGLELLGAAPGVVQSGVDEAVDVEVDDNEAFLEGGPVAED